MLYTLLDPLIDFLNKISPLFIICPVEKERLLAMEQSPSTGVVAIEDFAAKETGIIIKTKISR